MDNFSDEELVKQYLEGNKKALEFLIGKYLNPVYTFIYRYFNNQSEAEDAVQEAFLKVWKNIRKFNTDKSFKTWLFTIAKNTALDLLKKKKNLNFSDFDDEDEVNKLEEKITDTNPLPIEKLKAAESKKQIQELLQKLPIKYCSLLTLYFNNDFSLQQISEILGEPLNTIKSRYQRAIKLLQQMFKEGTE